MAGGTFSTSKYIDLRFKFDLLNATYCHSFQIASKSNILGYEMILGSDFMIANNACIDILGGSMSLNGEVVAKLIRIGSGRNSTALSICIQNFVVKDVDETNKEDRKRSPEMIRIERFLGASSPNVAKLESASKESLLQGIIENAMGDSQVKDRLTKVLLDYQAVFALDISELGLINNWIHRVETTSDVPIRTKQYNIAETMKRPLAEKLMSYLRAGIIEESDSPWNCPIIIKKKKGGSYRLVLDAKEINNITRKIDYPMVDVRAILAKLSGFKVFSTIDLESGYHQVALSPESKSLFSFRTPWGKFQYTRLPMGATNSGLFFQRVMEDVLAEIYGPNVIIFQDDVLIATSGIMEHIELLRGILSLFKTRGVTLKISKCKILQGSVKFLGHFITEGKFLPDKDNTYAIREMKAPRNKTAVRRFIGRIGFYSRFVPVLTEMSEPLLDLIRGQGKEIKWNHQAQQAFDKIKSILCNDPILHFPNYSKPFILSVSVGGTSVSSVLEQGEHGNYWPLGYFSRKLKKSETNYSSLEKEAYAIVLSLEHFHGIIYGLPVVIHSSRQALEYLRGLKGGNSRVSLWILRMIENSPTFVKGDDERDLIPSLMNETQAYRCGDEGPEIDIFVDGSCFSNGKENAKAGFGIFCKDDTRLCQSNVFPGRQTNNRVELLAVIAAISKAVEEGYRHVRILTDSKYVLDNVKNNLSRWIDSDWTNSKGKQITNIEEFKLIDDLMHKIRISWEHTPGHSGMEGNLEADILARRASGSNENCQEAFVDLSHSFEGTCLR